jgi:hypothetical protein
LSLFMMFLLRLNSSPMDETSSGPVCRHFPADRPSS